METAFLINRINKRKQGSAARLDWCDSAVRNLVLWRQTLHRTKLIRKGLREHNRGEVNNTHFYSHRCVARWHFLPVLCASVEGIPFFFCMAIENFNSTKGDKFLGMLFQDAKKLVVAEKLAAATDGWMIFRTWLCLNLQRKSLKIADCCGLDPVFVIGLFLCTARLIWCFLRNRT